MFTRLRIFLNDISHKRSVVYLVIIVILGYIIRDALYTARIAADEEIVFESQECEWKQGDPYLYNFRMKKLVPEQMGYEANHWFHFSEFFLPWFWILSANQKAIDPSNVYINIDEPGKVAKMNAFTRYLALSAVTEGKVQNAEYIHMKGKHMYLHGWRGDSYQAHEERYRYKSFILDGSMLDSSDGNHVISPLSDSVPMSDRFLTSENKKYLKAAKKDNKKSVCIKYMGSIGGQNPIARAKWFPNEGDPSHFQKQTRQLCGFQEEPKSPDKRSLVIYQRDSSRLLENLDAVQAKIKTILPSNWIIEVMYHNDATLSPCTIANKLKNVDIFLTPHGFQSLAVMFLPKGAMALEVYPYKYFKPAYSPLAYVFGVAHFHMMSPYTRWYQALITAPWDQDQCFAQKWCRSFTRSFDVRLTAGGYTKLKKHLAAEEQWRSNKLYGEHPGQKWSFGGAVISGALPPTVKLSPLKVPGVDDSTNILCGHAGHPESCLIKKVNTP